MHELSICRGLLKQLEEIAARHHARAIHRVTLRIGPLGGVEAGLLKQAFPLVTAGSIASNAELEIQHSPIQVQCTVCDQLSDAQPGHLVCTHCGQWQTRLISGDEMLLIGVEMDIAGTAGALSQTEAAVVEH